MSNRGCNVSPMAVFFANWPGDETAGRVLSTLWQHAFNERQCKDDKRCLELPDVGQDVHGEEEIDDDDGFMLPQPSLELDVDALGCSDSDLKCPA